MLFKEIIVDYADNHKKTQILNACPLSAERAGTYDNH
jgi:hypothetical protein